VTGASAGVGPAIVRALGAQGYVALLARGEDGLTAAGELESKGAAGSFL
jgi:NADP-dependent 3-hydroxy acid dehydrogenase YdfG